MKGRLFPSYEYRLFICDRRHDASTAGSAVDQREDTPARRDTVTMTAKNRGRKHQASNGVQPAPGASKKGVNNYHLYMPQQANVDTHYRSVNNNSGSATFMPNGASGDPSPRVVGDDCSVLLGRLQSNFIGTEFQIFAPTLQKHPVLGGRKPATARHPASSDSESDYEGASSNNTPTTPRRRNRFQRRRSNRELLRRSNRDNTSERNKPQPISEEESVDGSPSSDRRRTKRAYSLPNFSYRRSTRNSRRAVANSVDPADSSQHYQPLLYEVEDGAIQNCGQLTI